MKLRTLRQQTGIVCSVILLTLIFWGETAQAEKPEFKEKFNQKKKQAELELQVALPPYTLVERDGWTVLTCDSLEASPFTKQGEPELFSLSYLVSIPLGATIEKVHISPIKKRIELTSPLRPVPEPVPFGATEKPRVPDENIYNSQTSYPDKEFDYEIANQGSTRLLVLTIYPFKYKGESKVLLVDEYMKVTVFLKSKEWKSNPHPRNAVDRNLQKRLVNPDSAFFGGSMK